MNRLHGHPTSVYVTLSRHHEIGGNITFQGPIKTQTVVVSNTLDGVQVDSDSLLFTTHAQTHAGVNLLLVESSI